ncbi:MAG: GAF domain-containing protein [bacterium]|nr:GAF domain-containing protein [bacterium]
MTKLNLKKQNPVDVINRLIGLIQSSDDIIEIFSEANKKIARLVRCNQITILLANEKARYFYINRALNYNNRECNGEDIIIPYGETSFTEVLQAQRTNIRDDLTGKGKLTPGDLKFLKKEIQSDISIPIMNRNGVAGIINLGSHQTGYFTKSHQKFAEQVAALLGLAMERSQLNEKLNQKNAELQSWEKKFTCLMQNTSEAVAIVRSDYDLIYETNTAFQKLTGYSAEQLRGMRLSFLHPTYPDLIYSKLQSHSSNGKAMDFIELPLVKQDGVQVIVRLQFAAQKELNKDLVFAIYRHTDPVSDRSKEFAVSPDFIRHLFDLTKQEDFKKIFEFFLQEIYSNLGFKYAALKIVHPESKQAETVIVRKFPGNAICENDKSWHALLNQDTFTQISEKENPYIIQNISSLPENSPWQSLAKKMDFQMFIAIATNSDHGQNGIVSFFYDYEKKFTDSELDYLLGAWALFSLFTSTIHLNQRNSDRLRQLSTIHAILELANSGADQTEIVKNSLVTISKIIPFDFAELSLFDATGENAQNFTMVSESFRSVNPKTDWRKIEGAELYCCDFENTNLRQKFEHQTNESYEIEKLLRSSVPVVLMHQDKYLGTLVIGSLKSNAYKHDQKKFIEQAAQQIGLVIQICSIKNQGAKKADNFFDHAESISNIGNSLEIETVLSNIVEKSVAIMNAQLATIRLVDENHPASDLTMTNYTLDKNAVSDFDKNYILPRILIKNVPFLHEAGNHSEFIKHKSESLEELKTFFSVPIKLNNKTIAVLTNYWTNHHEIQVNELNFIAAIAVQSALAIENAKLHQNLRDSLFQTKTKYTEIENAIYRMSEVMINPISSIQGILSTLQNESFSKSNEMEFDHLASIKTNIEKIHHYVNDFQSFFRIHNSANSFEEVNIGDVISHASSELIDKLNEKKIKLVVDNAMPSINCNRDWMVQVFYCLIENAIDCFTTQMKNPIVAVGYQNVDGDHQFYVRDNGIGLTRENQDGLFDLFYHESSGDGQINARLPLVKRIIENHHGEIWLDSEEGKGSTFYFRLPQQGL